MSLTILQPGLQSLLQDSGRTGFQNRGVTTGGPLDAQAFAWANCLLGNEVGAAQIEICFGHFSARFEQSTCFAITGADLGWRLDGAPLRGWRTHWANAGSVLSAGTPRSGLRGYLAVQGGFQAPEVLGSIATVVGDRLGGLCEGKPLQASDQVDYSGGAAGRVRWVSKRFIPDYRKPTVLRVVPSNQFENFSSVVRRQFFGQSYRVSNRADRMGYRLEGGALKHLPGNMVSEAVPLGAIQMPSDGQPIVLLNDRQTIGGYPKLGNVYAVDLGKLAQCQPGEEVHFHLGNLPEAQHELYLFRRFFSAGV